MGCTNSNNSNKVFDKGVIKCINGNFYLDKQREADKLDKDLRPKFESIFRKSIKDA